ncbi:MAG: hypothetical protein ACRYGM_19710 [Janthinobacterium lividum]
MSQNRRTPQTILSTGIAAGVAGGLAEVVVVGVYTALTGGSAAAVARGVAAAAGIGIGIGAEGLGASAAAGLGVHMALAAGLGVGLVAIRPRGRPLGFMLGSLAAVWAVNFFLVLPNVSPGFVHLLPYAVTLASKLAFGAAAAGVLALLAPARSGLRGGLRLPAALATSHP